MADTVSLQAQIKSLTDSNKKLEDENKSLTNDKKKLEDDKKKGDDTNKELILVNMELNTQIKVLTDKLSSSDQQLLSLNNQLEGINGENGELKRYILTLEGRISEKEAIIVQKEQEVKEKEAIITQKEEQLTVVRGEFKEEVDRLNKMLEGGTNSLGNEETNRSKWVEEVIIERLIGGGYRVVGHGKVGDWTNGISKIPLQNNLVLMGSPESGWVLGKIANCKEVRI